MSVAITHTQLSQIFSEDFCSTLVSNGMLDPQEVLLEVLTPDQFEQSPILTAVQRHWDQMNDLTNFNQNYLLIQWEGRRLHPMPDPQIIGHFFESALVISIALGLILPKKAAATAFCLSLLAKFSLNFHLNTSYCLQDEVQSFESNDPNYPIYTCLETITSPPNSTASNSFLERTWHLIFSPSPSILQTTRRWFFAFPFGHLTPHQQTMINQLTGENPQETI